MKKTKLIMPIIGIAAIGSSIAPIATLSSCSKGLVVELTAGSKEKELYANSKVAYFYFTQNNLENCTKTKVKITNLKVNSAEAQTVAGLIKIHADSAGNIRVTIDVETMFNHYSDPETIEFDLLFTNKANNQTCTVEGFKFTRNVETYDTLFATDEAGTTITGFADGFDIETAAENYPLIFMPIDVPSYTSKLAKETNKAAITTYRMVIPQSTYTAIGEGAFADAELTDQNGNSIVSIEFAEDSTITTIGAKAFANAQSLMSIKLPKSITTLNANCFNNCSSLVSLMFPEKINSSAGLILPDGMAVGTSLSYVKIPTYVKTIGTGAAPVFIAQNCPLIVDFSEWDDNLLTTTTTLLNDNSVVGNEIYGIASTEDAYKVLSQSKIKFALHCVPYTIVSTPAQGFAQINVRKTANSIPGIDVLSYWLEMLATNYLPKLGISSMFAFPNYYTEGDTTYPITGFYTALSKQIYSWNQKGFLYSVVLPTNLAGLEDEIFDGKNATTNLWQLHISPTIVENVGQYAFSYNTQLSSIVFDGTETEWASIKTELLKASANEGCNTIDVYGNGFTDTLEYTAKE